METKYNYVFFVLDTDYFRVAYYDIGSLPCVKMKWSDLDKYSGVKRLLYRVHHSPKLNNKVRLPFKSIWYPSFFRNEFKDDKPLCFVFWGREAARYGAGYLDYLKRKYRGSKVVITFWDLVKHSFNDEGLREYRKFADLLFTYDMGDARKYDMLYQHDVFSKYPVEKASDIPQCDVYFLARAKDRLEELIRAYDILTAKGLACDFYITAVEPADRIERSNVHYLEQDMPYIDNLKHVLSAKALFELLQGGARGSTLRCCEAIAYGKALITNNAEVVNEPFYREKRIKVFSSTQELEMLDVTFIDDKTEYDCIDSLSPQAFIERMEKLL